ncbi:MAG: hypothetical protein COB14_00110 [Alphaproteobacteria bacterium]|nr:MAG: hypothetical protein COB14_00110 [Alphaproteobacteria bacterium]
MGDWQEDLGDVGLSRRFFLKGASVLSVSALTSGLSLFPDTALGAQKLIVPTRNLVGHHAYVHGENEALSPELSAYADEVFYNASLTKLVTLAKVFEEIDSGRLDWNDKIRVSERAIYQSSHRAEFEELSVRQACEMAGSASLNDATIALAERIAAQENITRQLTQRQSKALENIFVRKHMMPLVQSLDMKNTLCTNATGLPLYSVKDKKNGYETMELPNNYSTLNDMAKITSHHLSEYSDYMDVFAQRFVSVNTFRSRMHNGNLLLPGSERKGADPYDGVVGMKSGFINASGHHLICVKEHDGKTLVSMTIGSDRDDRVEDQRRILDLAVNTYEARKVLQHESALAL